MVKFTAQSLSSNSEELVRPRPPLDLASPLTLTPSRLPTQSPWVSRLDPEPNKAHDALLFPIDSAGSGALIGLFRSRVRLSLMLSPLTSPEETQHTMAVT
ncbi:hypothetical protein CEP51_010360 [Fusarium floridanum]|uniref:Uncharacterized protein n=1 Tax=Fusarium floridanum TaxID=1325733 RepID=A0A428RES4_9HYPO|nr:hypothetical protein CEP51_010360 [Fusarium floridanum]